MNALPTSPNVHTPDSYTRSRPKPKAVGFFSIDGNRTYREDLSQLKYLRVAPKPLRFDLNHNVEKSIRREEDQDEKINNLLMFLLRHQHRIFINEETTLETATIFCNRGLLSKVSATPYDRYKEWAVIATLFRGSIFLCAVETDDDKEHKNNRSEIELKSMAWGRTFEYFMLGNSPEDKTPSKDPVNENEEFAVVYSLDIKNHHVVYAAEMDGIQLSVDTKDGVMLYDPVNENGGDYEDTVRQFATRSFVELKTSRYLQDNKQGYTFKRYKLLRWWLQSYYGGVDSLVCGFRDDEGIVSQIRTYEVGDVCRDPTIKNMWKSETCFGFCGNFLTFMKRQLEHKMMEVVPGYTKDQPVRNLPMISLYFHNYKRGRVCVTDNFNFDAERFLHKWFTDEYRKPSHVPPQSQPRPSTSAQASPRASPPIPTSPTQDQTHIHIQRWIQMQNRKRASSQETHYQEKRLKLQSASTQTLPDSATPISPPPIPIEKKNRWTQTPALPKAPALDLIKTWIHDQMSVMQKQTPSPPLPRDPRIQPPLPVANWVQCQPPTPPFQDWSHIPVPPIPFWVPPPPQPSFMSIQVQNPIQIQTQDWIREPPPPPPIQTQHRTLIPIQRHSNNQTQTLPQAIQNLINIQTQTEDLTQ